MSMIRWVFKRISKTSVWVWFSRRVLSKWTLRMMGYPDSALSKFQEIEKVLSKRQPLEAYAFVSCDRKTPVAMLIKLVTGDRFSHAGMIINRTTIYDSRSTGVRLRNLLSMIGQADDFAIVKFNFKSDAHLKAYESDLGRYIGTEYDFAQELGGKALYCSELVYVLLQGRVNENIESRFFHGERGFSPGDVYNSGEVVFDHNP